MDLPGPLRGLFRDRSAAPAAASQGLARPAASAPSKHPRTETVITRPSRGLEEFFAYIRDQSGLTLLDLGGATQQNISFITGLGHRLYSENFLQMLHETFPGEDASEQTDPRRIESFLQTTLDYQEAQFDGVLIWDVLEHLAPPLLAAVVERLRRIVRLNTYSLAFFHAEERAQSVPMYTFRVQDIRTIEVSAYGSRRPPQLYNNRGLEKMFGSFASVKFFLARDRLREVVVKA